MNAQSISVFGGHQYLEVGAVEEVVSAPMPMVGNTVRLSADVYNMNATMGLTLSLEGSVLGQFWEDITLTYSSPSPWGASTSSAVAVTYAMVRVRAKVTGTSGQKAWFEVGIAFTDQG